MGYFIFMMYQEVMTESDVSKEDVPKRVKRNFCNFLSNL